MTPEDLFEVFERSYADRHDDLRRDRRSIPLRDCSNAACPARVAAGIPHCCQQCRDANLVTANGNGLRIAAHEHSEKCQARQIERGVTL